MRSRPSRSRSSPNVLGRISVKGAKFGTTNPESPAHWLKVKFLDRINALSNPLRDSTRWSFTIDDNPSLEPDYVERMKKDFTGLFYRRFILGEWVAADGAVFDFWNPNYHDAPKDPGQSCVGPVLGVGVDYGTTNATSAVLLGLGVDNVLYAIDEWRYDSGRLDPDD